MNVALISVMINQLRDVIVTREAQIIVAQRMDTTLDGATRMPNSAPYWQQIVLPINVTKCQKMAAQECSDSPMCFHCTTAF